MLVLTRKKNQSIMIGDDIEIVVLEIRGEQVRLGIKAPKDITVHRQEIYAQISEENIQAAQTQPEDIPKTITGNQKQNDPD